MKHYFFTAALPKELRKQYYYEILTLGKVSDELWNEITDFFEKDFKEISNKDKYFIDLFKFIPSNERIEILQLFKNKNSELFLKLSKQINSFEDIGNVEENILKNIFAKFKTEEIVKASLAVSPKVKSIIHNLYPDVDFNLEKDKIGIVEIKEIEEIHRQIVDKLNENKL